MALLHSGTAVCVFFTHPYYSHIPLLKEWMGYYGDVFFYGEASYGPHRVECPRKLIHFL